jgi:hypothetical protein
MIVRIWHGKTKTPDAGAYRNYVEETGIREYKAVKGNSGAQIWQQEDGDITHIWTVSWWDSFESIKAFAGEDYERAKYYEADKKFLLEFESYVQHYTCYDFTKKCSK